ncbi:MULTISPECIES: DUF2177 family protein [unclassified Polynucleobacter]|uniref:DUF2177 family protein n=1 Tax=unclassified Polynucleobacter TaxID=2640945 RepID=UPI0009293D97|nr:MULTISPECIES: DUF2177 family protein [unclassified Polynucleobacter]MBU3562610.1 DUF2177 family protein [Polynucleobacter sp. Tro8-14-1]MBU3642243.1 DUF2177 family protein [Polynucleobacter sp. Fuers-14]MEA9568637.1 DUF2177 family protein [Polynucleobacter sp. AP-Nickl1-40-C4]OJI04420.1 hypothetical protein AOC28_09275 [Polynucleobacter sp. MWH-Adler-W8]
MIKNFAIYLSFLIALIAIDLVWLLGIAKNLYRNEMGDLMASEPKLLAGLAFYLIYALGVCIFVIVPALSKQSWIYALQYGALFGLFCYMTYDLTNLAVVRNFPTQLAFIDIAWGSFVTALCASFAYWVGNRIS